MADKNKEKATKEAAQADQKAQLEQDKAAKASLKKVVSACSIDLDDVFAQLHLKALQQVKDCKILNSAIEGDGKKSKFHGAGSHIIAALPLKGEEIELTAALVGIKQYVTWFNGPDVAGKLSEKDLIKLDDGNTNDKKESNKNESSVPYIPSFSQFLTEETYKDKLDAEAPEKIAKNKEKLDDRGTKQKVDVMKNRQNPESTTAKGFYITYKISIEGQKESPLSDALKGFGAGLLKGLGIQGFSWKTGAKGKEHTIGDLMDTFDKVFGKIDPTELKTRFTKNAQAKYPLTRATDVQYYDKKTLLKYLGKKLDPKQKAKINTADYSLCYKVEANDKSKKLINTTVVADLITRSIKGLFKKFKNKMNADDVILVNDYDETDKDLKKAEKKLEVNTNDKKPVTTDSLKLKQHGKMLIEADEKNDPKEDKAQAKNLEDMTKSLEENAKKALGDNFEASYIWTKERLELNVDQTSAPDAFAAFSDKVKYAFVIETKPIDSTNKGAELETASMKTSVNSLMKMLFEEADDKKNTKKAKELEDKVNNVFKTLFNTFNKLLGKDAKPSKPKVYEAAKKSTKTESKMLNFSFVSKMFESNDFNNELSQLILEKDNGLTNGQAKQLIQLISKITLEKIRKNEDKISSIWENRDPGKTETNAKEYQKFSDLIFKDGVTEDEIFDFINKAKKVTQNPTRKQALTRFLAALKEADIEEDNQDEDVEKTIKLTFYDADPKTGKKSDQLGDAIEVPAGKPFNSSEEAQKAFEENDKKLEDDKKEGYSFKGWTPEPNDSSEEDTEIVAKYVEATKDGKKFTVMFQYAPDQEKPNDTEVIQVDGEDEQEVEAGEAAKLPDKIPEIEGYKFKDWGDDTDKLNNVEDDIEAIALYEKNAIEITFIDKDPTEQKPDKEIAKIEKEDGKKLELPEPPKHAGYKFKEWDPNPEDMTENGPTYAKYVKEESKDEPKEEQKEANKYWICPDINGYLTSKELSVKLNHTDVDFYIVPMKNLKMDNTDADDSKEVEGKGK